VADLANPGKGVADQGRPGVADPGGSGQQPDPWQDRGGGRDRADRGGGGLTWSGGGLGGRSGDERNKILQQMTGRHRRPTGYTGQSRATARTGTGGGRGELAAAITGTLNSGL
jgi:hypothetical protein